MARDGDHRSHAIYKSLKAHSPGKKSAYGLADSVPGYRLKTWISEGREAFPRHNVTAMSRRFTAIPGNHPFAFGAERIRLPNDPTRTVTEDQMSAEEQIAVLKAKHTELDTELQHQNSRPHPDQQLVSEIKKQKLRIKDELAALDDK